MARKVRITSYMKNLGRSLGYVVADVVGEYAPTAKSIVSDTKSTYQDIKFSMDDMKHGNISDAVKSFKSGPNILSNTMDDLVSGKWYNKEREEQSMNDMFGFDFDIDDFGDEDWGDDLDDGEEATIEHDEMNTREIISSMGKASEDVSKSVGYATAQSAKYVVANNNATSRALYDLNAKGFNQVSTILLNMSDTMAGLANLGQPLAAHMQNSGMFFTKATEALNKMSENLETLVKRTEYMENTPNKEAKYSKNGYDRFMSGNTFDLSSYIDMVKENIQEKKDSFGSLLDMAKMMVGENGKNTSLTSMLIKSGVEKLIPKITKDISKQFDEALGDTLGNGLMRLGKKGRSKGGIIGILSDVLFPKENIKTTIDPSKYEKGPMQWDGIARQSLTYVIPTYLAQMTALLAGVEDKDDYQYYDFSTGKFMSKKVYKKKQETDDRRRAKYAGGEFEKQALKSTGDERIKKEIEEYFYQSIQKGGDFYDLRKGKTDAKWREKYGNLSDEALNILLQIYEESYSTKGPNKNRNMIHAWERSANQEIVDKTKRTIADEASGMSFANHLYDDSDTFIYAPAIGGNRSRTAPRSRYANSTAERQVDNIRERSYTKNADGTYTVGRNDTVLKEKDFEKWLDAFNDNDTELMKKIEDDQAMKDAAKRVREMGNKAKDSFFNNFLNNDEENPGKESIFDKLGKVKNIIQSPIYAATMAMDTLNRGMNKLFYGENGNDGIIDNLKKKLSKFWEDLTDRLGGLTKKGRRNKVMRLHGLPEGTEDIIPDEYHNGQVYFCLNAQGTIIGSTDAFAASQWYEANRKRDSLKESMAKEWGNIKQKVKETITGPNVTALKQQYDQFKESTGFEGSGSGLVSGGDSAVPNVNRIGKSDVYTDGKGKYYTLNSENQFVEINNDAEGLKKIAGGYKQAIGQSSPMKTIKEGTSTLVNGLGSFFGKVATGKDEEDKEKKDIFGTIEKAFKDAGDQKGAMAIGAIAGTGVSLLTGAVVGPLAGAAIGAGVGLAAKSESFQNFLFGEGDPESEDYHKGLLGNLGKILKDKKNQDTLKSAGIGGGIGLVGGTLLGSPILGMVAGSAVGYVAKSEKAQKFLFGEGENKTALGKLKDQVKKKAPNIAAGAIAGLVAGPFGLVGNLLVGGGVGYLTSTEKFHNYLFGDPNSDDPEAKKGLAGSLHDKIISPIDNIIHNIGISTKQWLKNMGKSLKKRVDSFFKDRVKRYKDGDKSLLSRAIGVADKVVKAPINLVSKGIGKIDDITTKHNLNKGYNVWNAEENRVSLADERNQMRTDRNMKESSLDKAIAAARNEDDLDKLKESIGELKEADRIYKSAKNASISEMYQVFKKNGVPAKVAKRIEEVTGSPDGNSDAQKYLMEELAEGTFQIVNIQEVINAINKCHNEIQNSATADNGIQNVKQMLKDKFGVDAGDFDIENAEQLIEDERKYNKKFTPEQQELIKQDQAREETRTYQETVRTYLDDILEAIGGTRKANEEAAEKKKVGRPQFEDGKYTITDEEGNKTEISDEEANEKILNNKERTLGEHIRNAKLKTEDGIKLGAEITGEAIVDIGKRIGEAAQVIAHGTQAAASFIAGQVENGMEEADQAVADSREASDYTGNGFSRLKRKVGNGARRVGNFLSGMFTKKESTEETESGSGTYNSIMRKISGGEGEERKTEFTNNGPIQYVKNDQGEWVVDRSDTETKNTLKKQETFNDSIGGIGKISGLLGKVGGVLGFIKDGLFGSKKKKKKGILSKLFSSLFGGSGALTGLLSLITGKTGKLGSIVGSILSNPSGVLSTAFKSIIGPALLLGGFSGAFNSLGSILGKMTIFKGNDTQSAFDDNTSTQVTLSDGSKTYLVKNEDGSYKTDENGNYVDSKGNSVPKSDVTSYSETGSDTSVDKQLKKNLVNGAIMGKGSVTTKVIEKTKKKWANAIAKKAEKKAANKVTSKTAEKAAKEVAEDAVKSGLATNIITGIRSGLEKIPSLLSKIPGVKNCAFVTDTSWIDDIIKKLAPVVEKLGAKASSVATKVAKIAPLVQAVYIIGKGVNAWGNAGTILGITDEPTTGQKIIATMVAVVNAAIPVIGDLLPDKTLVNIFMTIAPKIGIDVSNLQEQREDAQKEVDQFNKDNGTDLSIEEYNEAGWEYDESTGEYKQGKSRAGIITKAKNKIKSIFKKNKETSTTTATTSTSETPAGSGSGVMTGTINNSNKYSSMFKSFLDTNTSSGLLTSNFKKDTTTFAKTMETLQSYAEEGNIKAIISTDAEFTDDNPLSSIYSVGIQINKIFQTISAVVYSIVNPIKKVISGISTTVDSIKNSVVGKVSGFISKIFGNSDSSSDGSGSNSGLISGGDSGFVNQYDPKYQQYKVSGQNFGAKGCGPAVASMAARAFGKSLPVGDAVRASNGYQNEGGVTLDYFQNALGSRGINTEVISGGSSMDMYSRIASGQKMILLGQDASNTSKDNSPFGPNNHYVLATGVDKSGNVIVNDPESRAPRAYSPAILANAKYGVAGSNSGITHKAIKRISGGESSTAAQIWYFFTKKGYSEKATAGIMGNLMQESLLKPETKVAGVTSGIACWDVQNGKYPIEEAAKKAGVDWRDLSFQLSYLEGSLESALNSASGVSKVYTYPNGEWCWWPEKVTLEQYKQLDNINDATEIFERCYERASKPRMENRKKFANEFYKQFTGKEGDPISTSSYGTSTSSDSSSSSSSTTTYTDAISAATNLSSIFSNAFGNIFGTSSSSDSSSTSSDGTSTGSSGSVDSSADTTASTGGKAKTAPTGDGTASSFVKIAQSQLGVIEGNENITDYGAFTGAQGQPWCASFVSWCMDKAFNGDTKKRNKALRGGISAAVSGLQSNFTNAGAMKGKNEAQAGDIVIYKNNASHTGLVEAVDSDGKVHTIEGNTSGDNSYNRNGGMVARKEFYPAQKSQLTGFGRPDWEGAAAAGSGLMSYNDIANAAGGASGLLIKSRAGSSSNSGIAIRDPRSGKLVPINISGGASNSKVSDVTTSMLNSMKSTAINKSKSGSVSSELVNQLLQSISGLLNSIANNTAPIEKIYTALVTYINSTSGSGTKSTDKVVVNKNNKTADTSSTVDSNISTLVGVLAELAKG